MAVFVCWAVLYFLFFMFGASVFSFLNVVIYRVPREMSFVKGFSICPSCRHRLGPVDLVPVFSWLFLRGKCRYCGEKIGVRDTLVEILGGFVALFCFLYFEDYGEMMTAFLFYCILTVTTFLDIDTMEIEDGCSIAVLVLSALSMAVAPGPVMVERLIGAVCVSVPMLVLALVIPGAFGGGDIKLMAACGFFLGWRATLTATAIAVLTGGFYGIWLLVTRKAGRKSHFAFGPFLCLGMAIAYLYADQLIEAYLTFALR